MKLIFYETPRAGKTTLRKQLLRHAEGKMLQPCGNMEPSTNIAEVCDPIFVQRIVMTNDENNEWKWTVQQLDDIAKSLLLCLETEQLRCESDVGTLKNASVIIKKAHQTPNIEQKKESVDTPFLVANESPAWVLKQETRDSIPCAERLEVNQQKRMTTYLDIKELFLNAVKTGHWEEVMDALNIDKAMFLQIFDGGGQTSFQETFPLLINGSSVIVLIFKLTDDLETMYPVQYQSKNERPNTWQGVW